MRGPNPDGVYYQPLPGSEQEVAVHRRGKRVKPEPQRGSFASPKKQALSQSISKYVSGDKSLSDFKKDLLTNDIEMTPDLNRLFRRNEVGDNIKFSTFGKEIFK